MNLHRFWPSSYVSGNIVLRPICTLTVCKQLLVTVIYRSEKMPFDLPDHSTINVEDPASSFRTGL